LPLQIKEEKETAYIRSSVLNNDKEAVAEQTRAFSFAGCSTVVVVLPVLFIAAKMPEDIPYQHPLFGGKISSTFPNRFQDVSNIREVPDHQEVFADPSRDESLIFELLELKPDVADNGSAAWFLQDLASEQDAEGSVVIEQSGVLEAPGLMYNNTPAVVTTAVGQMAISKGRQGREAQNIVKVYLANLRLKGVDTDVLVTAYEPIVINPLSESADTVGAGVAVPAAQVGCMPMDEVFKLAVTSFRVLDWGGAGLQFVIIVHVALDVALYPAIWDRNNVPPGSTVMLAQKGHSPQLVRGRLLCND
ncbi:Ran guanine nucleotide release factor, partial [Mucuna pruriens]